MAATRTLPSRWLLLVPGRAVLRPITGVRAGCTCLYVRRATRPLCLSWQAPTSALTLPARAPLHLNSMRVRRSACADLHLPAVTTHSLQGGNFSPAGRHCRPTASMFLAASTSRSGTGPQQGYKELWSARMSVCRVHTQGTLLTCVRGVRAPHLRPAHAPCRRAGPEQASRCVMNTYEQYS